jgi:hypothetical protein
MPARVFDLGGGGRRPPGRPQPVRGETIRGRHGAFMLSNFGRVMRPARKLPRGHSSGPLTTKDISHEPYGLGPDDIAPGPDLLFWR